ncbi:MAG: hypothetical protein WBZ48_09510 [Bacteroidota bacterium]
MSLGQTMISAAFFVLLTLAVLSANKMILENTKYYLQEEAVEQASNFANALISEILTKKFDSQVTLDGTGKVTGPYNSSNYPWPSGNSSSHAATLFDASTAMGASATADDNVMPGGKADVSPYKSIRGDNGNWFDDVDDYNGYKRTANSADISGYNLAVSVYYVKRITLSSPTRDTVETASFQTYWKRIDVTVTHSVYLPPKGLVFSAIATY